MNNIFFLFSILHLLNGDLSITGRFEITYEENYYIVEVKGVFKNTRNLMESKGLKVKGYIPDNAFLVYGKITSEILKDMDISGVVPYEGRMKYNHEIIKPVVDSFKVLLFEEAVVDEVLPFLQEKGFEILRVSINQWNKIIVIKGDGEDIHKIARIKWIRWIEPCREHVLFNNRCQWVVQTWEEDNRRIWEKGITGKGVIVSTSDSGIYTDHNMFRDPEHPIENWGDYPEHRKIIAYKPGSSLASFGDASSAYYHGTHTACTVAGNDEYVDGSAPYDGMAKDAKIYFVDIGAGGYSVYPPDDLNDMYIMPYEGNEAGRAILSSNSWGWNAYEGGYNIECYQTDQFMWNHKDFLILFSAGNDDYRVTPPGTAKDIITVGATFNGGGADRVTGFSDPGPTNDGRIKPTVVAPGVLISAYGGGPENYYSMSGTSMSCPAVAGATALIYQYLKDGYYPGGVPDEEERIIPSAALLKAMVMASTVHLSSSYSMPSNKGGWGRVCLDSVLYFPEDMRKLYLIDDTIGIETDEEKSFTVEVSSGLPLKIVLVWTDYPAELSSSKQLVNDLDLEVISPSGKVYYGNNFENGYSVEGGVRDEINVEELVWIEIPEEGAWIVKIVGKNIPFGPQPYAVVVTGDIKFPLKGEITYYSYEIADTLEGGNQNGLLDPGETAILNLLIKNSAPDKVYALLGVLKSEDGKVIVKDSISYFENVPPFSEGKAIEGFLVKAKSSLAKGERVEFSVDLYEYGEYLITIKFGLPISTGIKEVAYQYEEKGIIFSSVGKINDVLRKAMEYYDCVKIYTSNGRIVRKLKNREDVKSIFLAAGVYFIQMEKGEERRLVKFVNIYERR